MLELSHGDYRLRVSGGLRSDEQLTWTFCGAEGCASTALSLTVFYGDCDVINGYSMSRILYIRGAIYVMYYKSKHDILFLAPVVVSL